MKTPEQHNQQRMEQRALTRHMNDPHPNGIACPSCKKELWDSRPMVTLTSDPPQKNVHCPDCGYIGYRIA